MTVLNSMITFLIVVSGVLTFLACYIEPIQNTVKEATESILLYRLQAAKGRYFNYDRIATFIEENGVAYMLSNSINPVMYIVFKGLVGIVFGTLIGVSIELPIIQKIAVFILCFVIGFFGIDVIVKNNNEKSISLFDIIKHLPAMKRIQNIPYISEKLLQNMYAGIYQNEDISLFDRITNNPSSGGNPSSGSMSSRFF